LEAEKQLIKIIRRVKFRIMNLLGLICWCRVLVLVSIIRAAMSKLKEING
jgi:hypothetical protein